MKKRMLSLFCVLALGLTLLPTAALAAQDPVWYIERGWDGSTVTEQTKTVDTCTPIDKTTVTWDGSTTGGWYVASGNVTIDQRVTVTGDVYLILTDGCTLTINGGIQVEEDDSLTIYGQSDQADTMGRLTASINAENATIWDAAIGGSGSKDGGMDGGAVTIHGGFVSAMATLIDEDESTGGNDDESTGGNDEVSTHYAHGAAIGGGGGGGVTADGESFVANGGDGGTVIIYGGVVDAASDGGAAIGGGGGSDVGGDGGSITIYGGTVETESITGAGMGGGSGDVGGDGGTITINGGSVKAASYGGAAIGGGCGSGTLSDFEALSGGNGGRITINGGSVEARSCCGAAIGGGNGRFSRGGDGGTITINGGSVTAIAVPGSMDDMSNIASGAAIGGGCGWSGGDGGTVTINGGFVSATVTEDVAPDVADLDHAVGYGAAIGGGALDITWDDESSISWNSSSITFTGGGGGTIAVNGGTISAVSARGAAIGGGSAQATIGEGCTIFDPLFPGIIIKSGDGGAVTISGGTVSAESAGGAAIGSGGAPIYQSGSPNVDAYFTCSGGDSGTFATGSDGSAVLFATGSGADNHIQDDDDSSGWNGVIFLDGKGQVYGTSVTLQHDFTVPNGDTLEIRQDQTLSLAPDTTMTIYNEDCLTGAGTLDNGGGTYQILNPLPVFTPTTLVYTGSDLSDRLSLTAPADSVSIMGQPFTVSGTPTYHDWVITPPEGGILQVGTYTVTAHIASQDRTVSGQITVIADSSSNTDHSYAITVDQPDHGGVTASRKAASSGSTITLTVNPDEGYQLYTLTVTDSRGNQRELTSKGGGRYTFIMPPANVTVSAVFTRILPFIDVDKTSWYIDAVHYVYDRSLMIGTDTDRFSPNGVTSRAMIATILWRMAGSPVVFDALPFADVADGTWYTDAVCWASAAGIVDGYGDGTFGPDDPVTREQLAAMLYRYAQFRGYDVSVGEYANILSYSDAQNVSEWAISAMQWACGAGIVNGCASQLNPQNDATRVEIAAMLMRFGELYNP
ncbi:S-layer homology domain-containing protein [uncultured Flavonifractor sp.]|nr:S-layer homology domain-containing protein [uncultured Flavonifractor sp.]